VNRRLRLLLGYCFRRADFPWVALWEENRAISAVPWKGRTQARGLEFGTTPLPVARRAAFLSPRLFGESTMTFVPAAGRRTIRYVAFLSPVPDGFGAVRDVALDDHGIHVIDETGASLDLASRGLRRQLTD
jgi:hypothetical protein